MGLFDFLKKNKKQNNKKTNAEFVSENWREIVPYWGSIIAGDVNLEDGSKFDTDVIYNPKYLKYEIIQIELASIMAVRSTDDKALISNVRTCYMWLANFNTKIKDKHITNAKKMKDLVESEKDSKKLINKIADMDYDEKKAKKETAALNEAYEMQIKKFDIVLKKT
tara:strand:+ start:352 stop:849 length:498 start_codon:yes stop_codon:yes gene_type:complete